MILPSGYSHTIQRSIEVITLTCPVHLRLCSCPCPHARPHTHTPRSIRSRSQEILEEKMLELMTKLHHDVSTFDDLGLFVSSVCTRYGTARRRLPFGVRCHWNHARQHASYSRENPAVSSRFLKRKEKGSTRYAISCSCASMIP